MSNPARNLYWAIRDGKEEEVKLIIERDGKGSFGNVVNKFGWTALHSAACDGNVEALQKMIKLNPDIDQKDIAGQTALHWAAEDGHLKAVQFLLGYGSNPKEVNDNKESAKDLAKEKGKEEVFEFLQKIESKGELFPLPPNHLNYLALANDTKGLEAIINEAAANHKVYQFCVPSEFLRGCIAGKSFFPTVKNNFYLYIGPLD